MRDDMQSAAKLNGLQVNQAWMDEVPPGPIQEPVPFETEPRGVWEDEAPPLPTTRIIPAWQYRELEQIAGLDMSAFEADETQQEKPREAQRFYSNRAMRRAAARDKTRRRKLF